MYDWDDIDEFFDDDFAPEKATFNGVEYQAIRYTSDIQVDTVNAGSADILNFKLMLKVADFSAVTPPEPEDAITYGGRDYRIANVETDPNGKTYLLTLKDEFA